nr:hypothetical protein [Lachnospiraceae bacterium]
YESSDIISVYLNGLKLVPDEYTLDTSGATPFVAKLFDASGLHDIFEVTVQKSVIGFSQS